VERASVQSLHTIHPYCTTRVTRPSTSLTHLNLETAWSHNSERLTVHYIHIYEPYYSRYSRIIRTWRTLESKCDAIIFGCPEFALVLPEEDSGVKVLTQQGIWCILRLTAQSKSVPIFLDVNGSWAFNKQTSGIYHIFHKIIKHTFSACLPLLSGYVLPWCDMLASRLVAAACFNPTESNWFRSASKLHYHSSSMSFLNNFY
jgi:hypothetical protein